MIGAFENLEGIPNMEHSGFEIDILPPKPQGFPLPEPDGECHAI